uniref:Transporter n=1 Tax=Globodera rostochiensis TaxID=31243 RepID=A0A914HFJ1_GLORO
MLRWSAVHRRSSYWEPDQLQQRYAGTATVLTTTGSVEEDRNENDSPQHHQRHQHHQQLGHPRTMTMHGGGGGGGGSATMPPTSIASATFGARQRRRSYWIATAQARLRRSAHSSGGGSEEREVRAVQRPYMQQRHSRKYSSPGLMLDNNNNSSSSMALDNTTLGRGSFGTALSTSGPLLAIDDDENTTTEEEKSGTGIGNDAFAHGTELLPMVPKSLRKTSFCDEAIQKDIEQQQHHNHRALTPMTPNYQQLNGRASLLGVPANNESLDGGSVRRFSLQAAAALIRRRRSSFAREKWASKLEFLLAVIGYAVDLGNIWRFPSVCYKHGGGAFLIPYLVMLLVGGLPMFYMELVLGQFHRSGCLSIWKKICPMFKGIGYGICFICTFISCFYNTVIAHAVYFFIYSVRWEVPWQRCDNAWNTKQCRESFNATREDADGWGEELRTPSQEFYLFEVLESQKSTGLNDLGGIKFSMAFCPRSTGKIVWVTATAPYIVLAVLLVRGLTLPGASKGIYYYLMPNFDKLLEPTVWTAAATQIFFSLGPGFGVLLALSSYNDFNNNCYRDAVVTSLINCFTSFFSGFVIFSTLGYMSELTNRPVSEVVGEGEASLIFVVYPQAIATMNHAPIWSLIFFLMLITLGIDSTFSGIEAFITGFCDEYPRLLARRREIFVACVIGVHYIGSLPATTYGGSYVIPFLDEYGVSLSVLFIVMCEMIAVCWFYGIRRFSEDIRLMLGFYPGLYWRCCWTLCPLFIGIIFVLALYSTSFAPMQIPNYTYPGWSVLLGWVFRMLSCLSVPGYALYLFIITPGTTMQRIKFMLTAQQRPSMSSAGTFSIGGGAGGCTGALSANPNNNSSSLMVVMDGGNTDEGAVTGTTTTTTITTMPSHHFGTPRDLANSNDNIAEGEAGTDPQVNRLSIGTITASNNSRSRQSSFTSSSIAHL